jgi:aspartate 1-decarboxylase
MRVSGGKAAAVEVEILKAKLHRIVVTQACRDYEGSLTLDPEDMAEVGILPYEKILWANVENGERFETYAIEGEPGTHVCCLNGAAAHKGKVGDRLIVMAFGSYTEEEASSFNPLVKHF